MARADAKAAARVVVTGLGVLTPIGLGVAAFWRAALAGEVGTGEVTRFDTRELRTHRGGEVHGFEPARYVRNLDERTLPLSTQLAVAASRMAVEDAGLADAGARSERIGVCFGTVLGNRPHLETVTRELYARRHEAGWPPRRPIPQDTTWMSRAAAAELDLWGPNVILPTACAAGNNALTYASDLIRQGRVDAMVAGGADELSPAMFMMFNRLEALAPDFVRPFDRNRKGLMLADGAAALVLESHAHARARGARIYCEVLGYGDFTDAYHMTAPHPEGLGAIRSLREALRSSGIAAEQVGYVSAHGTGTPANDQVESAALRAVFGAAAESLPVSSLKSLIGHAQGAAGAIEAVACVLAIRDGVLPPNGNYTTPDPECPLHVVTAARPAAVEFVLNNAFGFGGNISCVVFSRWREAP